MRERVKLRCKTVLQSLQFSCLRPREFLSAVANCQIGPLNAEIGFTSKLKLILCVLIIANV